ncbi:DUF3137 domain-containing protein [Candidatus Bathyarchaeota archaeon]|nr:DUF3137 domain-containing protein [Candidatus Bathyarchaeota archaeon]
MNDDYEKWRSLRRKIRSILLVFGIALLLVNTILGSLNGMLIGFTLVGLSFIFPLLSYGVMRSKFPSIFSYEEWKKTINEMGLHEPEHPVLYDEPCLQMRIEGDYRNRHVTISEYDYSDAENPIMNNIFYDVEFENSKNIIIYIKKRHGVPFGPIVRWSRMGDIVQDIELGDPEFDKEFSLKGNKETEIKMIMDQFIRNKILDIKSFYLAEIGHPYSESPELKAVSNIARYIDAKPLGAVKLDVKRFRLTLDTMIDIVEKIEVSPD